MTPDALTESDLAPDPLAQFRAWFAAAQAAGVADAHAMTLATSTPDGYPSARVVLLNRVDERGFVFYTNYESRKGRELAANPRAALVFFWPQIHRQVRVVGVVSKVSREESEQYFASRPVGSQLGAWASRQSQVIATRAVLDDRLAQLEEEYRGREVPCPPFWGGYRVTPEEVEFWQSRPNRLHDRFRYRRGPEGAWQIELLSP
ncbi:MAG: pyridoxamine 5'-phosphate oxidase [Anaerolineae bacterium]